MGGFLTIAGVAGARRAAIEWAFRAFARERGGRMERDGTGLVFPEGLLITPGKLGRIGVTLPHSFLDSERLARDVSKALAAPVFLFHVHDGDLWMYWLFSSGRLIDRFNPIPDYWGDLPAEEQRRWAGSARKAARHWPDLKPAAIERYLVRWKLPASLPKNARPDNLVAYAGAIARQASKADRLGDAGKAYPDDVYPFNDCRQLADFMRRLGLKFPLDENDEPLGDAYTFELPRGSASERDRR